VSQWLRLHTSHVGGMGLIPGQGTKIPHARLHGQKKLNNFLKTLGSEDLKKEQEFVRQDGKWKGCFGQGDQSSHNGRNVRVCALCWTGLEWQPQLFACCWSRKETLGACKGGGRLVGPDAGLGSPGLPKDGLMPSETPHAYPSPKEPQECFWGSLACLQTARGSREPLAQTLAQALASAWPPHPHCSL